MSVQQLGSPVVTGWLEVASESVTAAAAVPRAALSDVALTPSGGHLVREAVHHGKTTSGVHS